MSKTYKCISCGKVHSINISFVCGDCGEQVCNECFTNGWICKKCKTIRLDSEQIKITEICICCDEETTEVTNRTATHITCKSCSMKLSTCSLCDMNVVDCSKCSKDIVVN